MNRRSFIKRSLAAAAGMGLVPSLFSRTAMAAGGNGKILVVMHLFGGNDAINTVIPYAQPEYAAYRPDIGIPTASVLPLGASGVTLGLHPAMQPMMDNLWNHGELAIVTSVGYPHHNRSHFYSTAVWNTADPDQTNKEGWLGPFIDEQNDPFCATSFGGELPRALRGVHVSGLSIDSISGFGLNDSGWEEQLQSELQRQIHSVRHGTAEEVRRAIEHMLRSIDKVQGAGDAAYAPSTEFPNSHYGRRLADVSRLIKYNFESQVYYTAAGGYDSHSNQGGVEGSQANNLAALSEALAAFRQEMVVQGRWNDVMVLVFSEFGRRAVQNASGGTDHGKGGALFVAGGAVNGGVYGGEPQLAEEALDGGDLAVHTDFRSVYADAARHIGANPAELVGPGFDPIGVI